MSAHGLIGTLTSFFAGASSDPSIEYRTHDYPVAEQLWQSAPWFGHGPGTYIPADSLNIFDNQYLETGWSSSGWSESGARRLPAPSGARSSRRSATGARIRTSASCARRWPAPDCAGAVCSLTFDSLSFPMFVNVYALLIGLIGACWRLAAAGATASRSGLKRRPLFVAPTRIGYLQPTRFSPRKAGS